MLVVICLQVILTHTNNGLCFLSSVSISYCSGFGKSVLSGQSISFNCCLTQHFNSSVPTALKFCNFKFWNFGFHDVSSLYLHEQIGFVYYMFFAFVSMALHNYIGLHINIWTVMFLNSLLFSLHSYLNQFNGSSCAYTCFMKNILTSY